MAELLRDLSPLRAMDRTRRDMAAELSRDRQVVQRFLSADGDLFLRTLSSPPEKRTDLATCTGFALYYLTNAGLIARLRDPALPRVDLLSRETAAALVEGLAQEIEALYGSDDPRPSTVAPLPNQYDSAIQVAGCLRASKELDVPARDALRDAYARVIRTFLIAVETNNGYVKRLSDQENLPSPYLTFWVAAALREYANAYPDAPQDANGALELIGGWAEGQVATYVSYHHAGLRSRFDIVELVYSLLTALTCEITRERLELAAHALPILFDRYFSDGCFMPSWPVLADGRRNFSLQCPTTELIAPLLWAAPQLLYDSWGSVAESFRWLRDNRRDRQGWSPENVGYFGEPTVFMTVSAVALMAGGIRMLDDALNSLAREALHVEPLVPNKKLANFEYPADLDGILKGDVIRWLKESPRRPELAHFSMILFGLPGASKTTIAKKLAQDLEWPCLFLDQGSFVGAGLPGVIAEADRIFALLRYLKNVVVVFDEVEELVRERGEEMDKLGRVITNTMLPRIDDLRAAERVFFVFITNHAGRIDSAIQRPGRFDIVRGVEPPAESARRRILEVLFDELHASDDVRMFFDSAGVVERTKGLMYNDIRLLVRHFVAERPAEATLTQGSLEAMISKIRGTDREVRLDNFKEEKRKLDRD